MSRPKILCVDDEPRVLQGLMQVLFKSFEVTGAAGGAAALAILDRGDRFEAVVSDMQMPSMNGAALLAEVRRRQPHVSRLLLTGHTNLDAAIAAVNHGQIFRFLTKPCPPEELMAALNDAVAQHRLLDAERVLLEQTLVGSVRALSEVLALVHPEVFGPTMRQHARVRALAEQLGVQDAWQVEVASMLSSVGYVILPTDVATKLRSGEVLKASELEMVSHVPGVVERVLSHIPRLEAVRSLLKWQETLRDTAGACEAPVAARVLHAVADFGGLEKRMGGTAAAIHAMRGATQHAAGLVEALAAICQPSAPVLRELSLDQIESGMTLAVDVVSKAGILLMAQGQLVTEPLLQRLRNVHARLGVVQPVLCELPRATDAGSFSLAKTG